LTIGSRKRKEKEVRISTQSTVPTNILRLATKESVIGVRQNPCALTIGKRKEKRSIGYVIVLRLTDPNSKETRKVMTQGGGWAREDGEPRHHQYRSRSSGEQGYTSCVERRRDPRIIG
jgi:hypothetical protein